MKNCTEYCTGCELCQHEQNISFYADKSGFLYPDFDNRPDALSMVKRICPFGINGVKERDKSVWGHFEGVYEGCAANPEIRYKASSGGVTTAVVCFLLEAGYVDGVIQTSTRADHPFKTVTVVSKTPEDIIACSGSRYCQSNPLSNIGELITAGMKYAFVGKPCDVSTLRRYMDETGKWKDQIICLVSFFCAGMPSDAANEKLLASLGMDEQSCSNLRYRGFGWPGLTTATDKEGNCRTMTYQDSWMNILGRDIRKSCKFCFDGIGEFADISSGDLWTLVDGKPCFDENDGKNVVFGWTDRGNVILKEAVKKGYIRLSDWKESIDKLRNIQPNHFQKRTTLFDKILAMRLMGRSTPSVSMRELYKYSKDASVKTHFNVFKGTIKRCIQKRI